MHSNSSIPLVLMVLVLGTAAAADDKDKVPECAPGVPVELSHPEPSDDRSELSGLVLKDDLLLTLSNEALDKKGRQFSVQVFKGTAGSGYQFVRDVMLYEAPEGACKEADFEALTRTDDTFFAITSHSADRNKQKPGNSQEANRRNLTRDGIEQCDSRHQLLKFKIGDGPNVDALQTTSLRDLIATHPVLEPFSDVANKENGVDIEGLAAFDDNLFVGFRGPVLRQNYVPVLRLSQNLTRESVEDGKLVYVNLHGRGIRDIAPGPKGKGLVILAGPNGDERQSFAIYFWDGRDQIADRDRPAIEFDLRCDLGYFGNLAKNNKDNAPFHKPEGIAHVDTTDAGMRFLMVYDGPKPLKAELRTVK
jgi:hypothetical protein